MAEHGRRLPRVVHAQQRRSSLAGRARTSHHEANLPVPLCRPATLRLVVALCRGLLDGMQEVSWPTPTLSDVGEQCAAAASSRPG
jgi:hypothetical protein